jgi:SET domain-containing protein
MSTKKNAIAIAQARLNNLSLIVKPSGIQGEDILHDVSETVSPGNGVFTTHAISKDEYISYYTGWIINYTDYRQLKRLNAHSHFMTLSKMRECIMGVETQDELSQFPVDERGLCSFINHSNSPNAESVIIDGHVLFRALKNIPANHEIFISYGKYYWEQSYIRDAGVDRFRREIMSKPSNKTTFTLAERRSTRRGGRRKNKRTRRKKLVA